ncbi:hypothetical protein BDN71DRAFT_1510333 [Pleurotus eryngii]|uniref:Uncharacterized protein n=1 Tax=Pleurotus eryngii TaxID=5323 RepID=A0A9P6D3S7_PLEER|nr:hypothetical protein BDN71DRAFT_1510333 [Pleurotus eryngii]
MSMDNEPLCFRTGTPKFIARFPAIGCLLIKEKDFEPMPILLDDLARKYIDVYPGNRSELQAFNDDDETYHGRLFEPWKVQKKHKDNPNSVTEEFEHCPQHDAESVFWCMVVFLLVAVPFGGPDEVIPCDPAKFLLFCAWRHIANHQVSPLEDICDSRASLLAGGELWNKWLHLGLAHAGPLLASLASQVSSEWSLLDPQPHNLHLHEAMQCIILTHINLWKKKKLNVKFNTGRVCPMHPPDNCTVAQVCVTPSIDGQHITAGTFRTKQQSEHLGLKEESQAKSAC